MNGKCALALCSIMFAVSSASATPQFSRAEDAIRYRKASFVLMQAQLGRISAMINGRQPFDARAASESAEIVAFLSKLPFEAFSVGTDKGDTRAKAEVWSERARFQVEADRAREQLLKLRDAARSGNAEQLKAAFAPAAQACKSCHQQFRRD
ncbi:MAG TPA: cytochrome c [Burkholderiaceae bacterium]|nr:cytochrome c [Burkholderiaceae bacterium]